MKNLKPKPNLFDELLDIEHNNEKTYYVFDDVDTIIDIHNLYRNANMDITPKKLLTAQYLMSKLNFPLMNRNQNFYLKVNYWTVLDFLCFIAEVRTPEADS